MTDKTSSAVDSLPDQIYINQVRDALWDGDGRASVMIGSGFSKNAIPTRPDAGELPSWSELASEMLERLYPSGHDDTQPKGGSWSSTSDGFLQVFQDYETHFGRSALHLFLEQMVRDGDFAPGEQHQRMLKLPWRDVFATNWDTLLERTRSSVPERGYSVVHNKDEIPLAHRPRIVKLHGTLGGHYPLIATKKDYEDYPGKSAPLVNTVQQAMMETVLCLIGFSGDDPNFQEWSRWVGDNLGESAPKIYLAGWLCINKEKRAELVRSNVIPIDLARHPQGDQWPEHLQHRYATEWILHTLERGEPYPITDWPSRDTRTFLSVPSVLEPVENMASNSPMVEHRPSTTSRGSTLPITEVRETISVWAHNRSLYPGWLAAPPGTRWSLVEQTERWEAPILNSLHDMPPVECLNALRELIWRHEITLHPLSPRLVSTAEKALETIDCSSRTVEGSPDSEVVWAEVREAWREVALSLLTEARYRLDGELFDTRVEAMSPFLEDHPDVVHRIHHERCLWAIWFADFESLEEELEEWQTVNCDPVWMMRKSAVLFQCGREEEAQDLNHRALEIVRGIPSVNQSVVGASRESWAMLPTMHQGQSRRNYRRWAELAILNCDADSERIAIANSLSSLSDAQESPDFDLGYESAITARGVNVSPQADSYRAIRQSEVAGVPPFVMRDILRVVVFSGILKSAAAKLADVQPELAIRLVLQNCDSESDDVLKRVLSRTRVALLPVQTAQTLANDCIKLIEYGMGRGWVTRPRVALEVLSRLVLRLDPELAQGIFDKALAYYGEGRNSEGLHTWLSRPLRNLLQRSWDTMPYDQRADRLLDVLGAPIVGLDGFTAAFDDFPDVGDLLDQNIELTLPERAGDNEEHWRSVVSLLIRGLRAGGEARKRASFRMVPIANQCRLTPDENVQLGAALWASGFTPVNGLPGGTVLYDGAFLTLPEPATGMALDRFRRKWLSTSAADLACGLPQQGPISIGKASTDPSRLEDTLLHLGAALSKSAAEDAQSVFHLTEELHDHVVALIDSWAAAAVQVASSPIMWDEAIMWQEAVRYTRSAIQGLKSILVDRDVPEYVAERLFQKVKELTAVGVSAFDFAGELIRFLPDKEDEIISWLRLGLASNDPSMVSNALVGLDSWMVNCQKPRYSGRRPPIDLVREIGLIVAVRRREALSGALDMAKRIFEVGSEEYRDSIKDNVLQGLEYLIEELRYDRERSDDNQVPLLRWMCARLAGSMSTAGYEDEPIVVSWLEIAQTDPLPEVRLANTR